MKAYQVDSTWKIGLLVPGDLQQEPGIITLRFQDGTIESFKQSEVEFVGEREFCTKCQHYGNPCCKVALDKYNTIIDVSKHLNCRNFEKRT